MKRISLSLVIILLVGLSAIAQIKIGARLGLTSSSLSKNDFTTSDGKFQYQSLSSAKVGVQGGLILQVTFMGMFIQPEFLLSSTGGEVEVKDLTNGTSTLSSQRFTKLDIPILLGEKLGPLRLGIGPVASIILNKPSDAINFSGENIENKFNSATFGFQVGAGLDLGKLGIDLKYEGNLSKLGNGVTIGGHNYSFDSRNHQWILGLALFF